MMTADQIINSLRLKPHPEEGGYFVETYRSEECILKEALPDRYDGGRSFATAIYYLLTPDTFSSLHRLQSDEIFHFYLGDPVEMLQLWPDGGGKVVILGPDILDGMVPQVIVPRGIWQGARVVQGGKCALLGTTVAPGFDFRDYESGRRDVLVKAYPQFRDFIVALAK